LVDTKDQLDTNDVVEGPSSVQKLATDIRDSVQRVIVGKSETIDIAVLSLLCRCHLLLEDVPGTGKTTLAKALAASLDCQFGRIQFTPDLVPARNSNLASAVLNKLTPSTSAGTKSGVN
jgi:MoxR-like ATPase